MADLRDMTPEDRIETLRWEAPTGHEVGRDTEGSFTIRAKKRKAAVRRHGRRTAKRMLRNYK